MVIELHKRRYDALRAGRDERTAAFDMVGGGDYELVGFSERLIVDKFVPVPQNGFLIDIGCGPGRLARYLAARNDLRYLGTDVVDELLEVARKEVQRPDWKFASVKDFTIPASDSSADVVVIFSVLTNVYHEQGFAILSDAARVLKSGGRLLVTYFDIEYEAHQRMFSNLVANLGRRIDPLVFLNAAYMQTFAGMLNLDIEFHGRPTDLQLSIPAESKLLDGRPVSQASFGQCVIAFKKR
jgi:SAM-dependent methyltransferase